VKGQATCARGGKQTWRWREVDGDDLVGLAVQNEQYGGSTQVMLVRCRPSASIARRQPVFSEYAPFAVKCGRP
jgi:hypothetical protein